MTIFLPNSPVKLNMAWCHQNWQILAGHSAKLSPKRRVCGCNAHNAHRSETAEVTHLWQSECNQTWALWLAQALAAHNPLFCNVVTSSSTGSPQPSTIIHLQMQAASMTDRHQLVHKTTVNTVHVQLHRPVTTYTSNQVNHYANAQPSFASNMYTIKACSLSFWYRYYLQWQQQHPLTHLHHVFV